MKHNINMLRGVTLLTAIAVFCLGAGAAQCQRGGRSVGRATTSQAATGQTSGSQGSGCTNSSSSGSSTSSSTTASGTATTTLSSGSSVTAQSSSASGTVTAQRIAANQLVVQWAGNTSNVQAVYIGLLDANGGVISQRAVTSLPVQASLTLTSSARYYGVQVVYANGTTHTTYTPIR